LLFIKNKSLDHFSHATLKLMAGEQEAFTYLTHFSETYSIFDNYAGTSLLWNSGNGLILRTDPGGRISFETTNYGEKSFIEHMRMTSEGNFGIGTINPKRTLHIRDVMRIDPRYSPPEDPSEGDIYMDGNDHRLKVFDGEIWRSCW
jgi:hypothetical protein